MKLEQSFEVAAPLESVWAALIDVQRVAPCLPGAEITGTDPDGTYHGTFSVKLGPATASYRGTLKIEDIDQGAHRATMRASGTDKRGQGGAKALMQSTVRPGDGGGTLVEVETDFTITGRLASFSRGGMMRDISNRLLGDFAACLQETLTADRTAGPGTPDPGDALTASTSATPGEASGAGTATPSEARTGGATPSGEGGAAATGESAAGATPGGEGPGAGSEGPTAGERSAAEESAAAGPAAPGGNAAGPRPQGRPPAKAKPISGFGVLFGALWDRVRRLFGRRSRSGR